MASISFLQAFSNAHPAPDNTGKVLSQNIGKSQNLQPSFYDAFAGLQNPGVGAKINNYYASEQKQLNLLNSIQDPIKLHNAFKAGQITPQQFKTRLFQIQSPKGGSSKLSLGQTLAQTAEGVPREAVDLGKGIAKSTYKAALTTGAGVVNLERLGLSKIPGYGKYTPVQKGGLPTSMEKTIGNPNLRQYLAATAQTGALGIGGTGVIRNAIAGGIMGAGQAESGAKPASAKSLAVNTAAGAVLGGGGTLLGKAVAKARAAKAVNPNTPRSALDRLVEQVNQAEKKSLTATDKTPTIKGNVRGAKSSSVASNAKNQLLIDGRKLNTAQTDALNSILKANGKRGLGKSGTLTPVSTDELKTAATVHPPILQNSEIRRALSVGPQKTSSLRTSSRSGLAEGTSGQSRSAGNATTLSTKLSDISGKPSAVGKNVGGEFIAKPSKDGFDVWTGDKRVGQFVGGAKDQRGNPIGAFRLYDSKGNEHLLANVDPTQLQKNLPSIMSKYGIKPEGAVGKNVEPETPNPITATKGTVKSNFSKATTTKLNKLGLGEALHQAHDFKQMETNAKNLVESDHATAHDMFMNGNLSKSNPDAHIKLGNALLDDAVKRVKDNADYKTSVQPLLNEYTSSLTRAGQGLGAARTTFSPETMTRVAIKKADLEGRSLKPEEIKTIRSLSAKISAMAEGPQKAQYIEALKKVIDQPSAWDKTMNIGKNVVSLPRALMASTDVSFIGRQGAVLGARHPIQALKAFGKGTKYFVSSKSYQAGMGKIANLTDKNGEELLPTLKKMGVDLEGVKGKSEEVFGTPQLAERLPIIGRIVAASDRSFTGTAAELRANVMKQIINKYGGVEEINKTWTTKDMKDMGRVINTMTGRGHGKQGGWFEKAAPALGQTLFSARLWKSRLDMLNPVFYARLAPAARKEALQSAGAFATMVAVTLAAAKAAGADVETNPISSDFGKIKVGNTRIDIMGGLQQNIVLAAREIEGKTKSSTTGAVTKLNNKYGGPTRLSTALGFIQNKETPTLGTTSRILGANPGSGAQVTNPWGEVAKLFIPLGPSDIVQATQSAGAKGALLGATTEFGTGVQTYSAQSTTNWSKNPGKILSQFQSKVTPQQFQQANKDYNNAVTQWYKTNLNSAKYKSIPDEQKNAYITKAKAKIKSQIFKQYNFTYHK